jgi:RNHCP domain-containing protein
MKPAGLTMKKGRNKYRLESRGELMLIHECTECGSLSINRIAADDDSESILEVFDASLQNSCQLRARSEADGILVLNAEDDELVRRQLFGQNAEMPVFAWSE